MPEIQRALHNRGYLLLAVSAPRMARSAEPRPLPAPLRRTPAPLTPKGLAYGTHAQNGRVASLARVAGALQAPTDLWGEGSTLCHLKITAFAPRTHPSSQPSQAGERVGFLTL